MEAKENLITVGAMARVLKVPTRWLRQEADAGRLPHLRADDRLLFEPQTVKRLLIERAKKGAVHA